MIRALCLAFIGLGAAALAWGYWQNGVVAAALALLLFGALELVAQWRWPQPVPRRLVGTPSFCSGRSDRGTGLRAWFSALGLVVTAAAAAAGLILGAPSGWMIAGALGGLLAWDLADLDRRLGLADSIDDLSTIRRRHLTWLGLTAGTGLLLTSAAMLIPLHFSFALTVFLALAAVLGMARLVSWLHRG